MPTVYVPHRDLHMFYVVNPSDEIRFSASPDDPVPECRPIDPKKPTILFFHAATSSIASFSAQLRDPRLAGSFNLVAFDARCHGRTTAADRTDHSIEASSTCLLAAIDALGIEQYAIFGESVLGVGEAVSIAIQRPRAVLALALASPGYRNEPAHILESLEGIRELSRRHKNGRGDGTGRYDDETLKGISQYFFGDDDSRLFERKRAYLAAVQLRYGLGKSNHDFEHCLNFGYRQSVPDAALRQITCPVLILQGSEDKVISPESAAREWQQAFGGEADLRTVAGAPHLLSYTDYNIVNRMLAQFVTRSVRGHL